MGRETLDGMGDYEEQGFEVRENQMKMEKYGTEMLEQQLAAAEKKGNKEYAKELKAELARRQAASEAKKLPPLSPEQKAKVEADQKAEAEKQKAEQAKKAAQRKAEKASQSAKKSE